MAPDQGNGAERRVGRRADQKRRWDRENRATCRCGRKMDRQASRCAECVAVEDAELGMTSAAVRALVFRLRARGVSVPAVPTGRPPRAETTG